MATDHQDYCFDQVRHGDRDRYMTLLFASSESRGDLAAIAAFNLELARTREQVSESLLGHIRLQWWREVVEEIRGGGAVRQHQVALALAAATRARTLDTDRMLAMIDARDSELASDGSPCMAEFQARADATAGNVLFLSLQATGADLADAGLAEGVRRIGRAYAAVGIARSVARDAQTRMIRLPGEALAAAGVDVDRLFALKAQPELSECVRGLMADADRALAEARAALSRATARGRMSRPLILTGRLAALHLERLRRAAYDPFHTSVTAEHPMDVWRLLWSHLTGRF